MPPPTAAAPGCCSCIKFDTGRDGANLSRPDFRRGSILFLRYLIAGYVFLILAGRSAANDAVPPGFVEGHVKIVSLKPVELADGKVEKGTAETYSEYPLIIFSQDGQKEIARVIADKDGNYRVALPPGDYILDVQGRGRGRVRAKPEPFTIASNKTVRVDMNLDTGIR
jgi:hypothetical protein